MAVRDGLIEAVGDGSPPPGRFDRTIDASGCVVTPGLVNAHTHTWYGLFRGLGEGLDLEAWLERRLFPLGGRISESELVLGARLGCLEMLATGTTTAFDHSVTRTTCATARAVAAAAAETGLRLVVGKELRAGDDLDEVEELLAAVPHAGLAVETARHWVERGTTTDELVVAAWELARRHGRRISDHVATGRRDLYAGGDISYLHALGVLDEHWLLAHGIWIGAGDLPLLGAAAVVDTPTSQAARGGGVTPTFALREAGVAVALGTDGPMVDASIDMLEQAKALLGYQHQVRLDACAFSSRQALELATLGNARALGLDGEIGSLEPGKAADLAVFDLRGPHVGVVHDPVVSLVTAARGADARWVVAGGEVAVDDGLLAGDYDEVKRDATAAARLLHPG